MNSRPKWLPGVLTLMGQAVVVSGPLSCFDQRNQEQQLSDP